MSAISFFDSKECEWADMTLSVSGAPVTKVRGVKYGVKTEKKHLFAAGDDPVSIQSGNREPSGTIKVLKSAIDAINAAAVTAGGRDITDLVFDVVIFYKPKGPGPIRRMRRPRAGRAVLPEAAVGMCCTRTALAAATPMRMRI